MEAVMNTISSMSGTNKENQRMSVPTKDKLSGDTLPQKRLWGIRTELILRRLLADVMKGSGKNRSQIADEMSRILGCPADRPIAKNVLDDSVRSRKKGRMVRFPAAWIPALCQVTGNDELQRWLAGPRLRELIELGEQVCSMRESSQHLLDLAARFRTYGRETKGKRKPTRKA
jgi:hypothetical protein